MTKITNILTSNKGQRHPHCLPDCTGTSLSLDRTRVSWSRSRSTGKRNRSQIWTFGKVEASIIVQFSQLIFINDFLLISHTESHRPKNCHHFSFEKGTFLPRSFTGNLTVHAFEPGGTLAFSWMRTIVLPLNNVFLINGILMIWPLYYCSLWHWQEKVAHLEVVHWVDPEPQFC